MTGRKCSTCKHYEPAPIWRKGWCRNPLLYSPQQSHLVGEDDLDCERGMGNYWELSDASQSFTPVDVGVAGFDESVSEAFIAGATRHAPSAAPLAPLPYAISGGSIGDPPDEPPIPARRGSATGGRGRDGGGDRQLNYYAEDRYWTDYLRIAAPVLGVLLMVALFWLWASSFLGNNNTGGNLAAATGTRTTLPTISSTPGASPTGNRAQTTPSLTAVRTPQATATTTGPAPSQTTGGGQAGGAIYAGATVQVANTAGVGANLRASASASAEIVATLLDGTQLVTTGEPIQAEGYVWWPVQGDAGSGYIVADYLALVP